MTEEMALSESLAGLSRFFIGDQTVQDTLSRVAELAVEAVPVAAYAGMTTVQDGRVRTSVFTDPSSPQIDQAQYDAGVGPCLDALRYGDVFIVRSTVDDRQWRPFS